MPPDIETLSSEIVYENPWTRVREDRIRRADGSEGVYGVVEKPDFACVAAVEGGRIHLVEQYRYPVGARYWELPQGTSHDPTIVGRALAEAELREETGLTAASFVHAGRLFLAYGLANQAYDVWLATGLVAGTRHLEPEEADLVTRDFAIDDVIAMIADGTIVDATTVAAIGLLRIRGLL